MPRTIQQTVQDWHWDRHTIIYAAIKYVVNNGGSVAQSNLVNHITPMSNDPEGAVRSMCSSSGNNYGDVFVNNNGIISINPSWANEIRKYQW